MQYYISVLKKYAEFKGRASRAEFWWFVLCNAIISSILLVIDFALGTKNILSDIYAILTIVPGTAVGIRRLHDIGRSGWWYLIIVVPIVGVIVLIVFDVKRSQPGTNAYGPMPAEAVSAPAAEPVSTVPPASTAVPSVPMETPAAPAPAESPETSASEPHNESPT